MGAANDTTDHAPEKGDYAHGRDGSEYALTAQDRGKEWECGVSAVNKAGEGAPSNTVMAVL